MEFHPAVLPVHNIGTHGRNSFSDEIFSKDPLAEAITHSFDHRVALCDSMAADRLQNKVPVLLFEICLIQKRTVFRVEVELDVPITIFF